MTATEYLDQIRRLDQLINSKLTILSSLEASATRTTGIMEGETVSHTRNVHALQDTIARIMDLNKEIEADTDALVDLREEALHVIQRLDNASCQTVLTLRYVWLKPWDAVAAALAYNLRSVYKVRDRAIAKLDGMIENGTVEIGQSRALEGKPYMCYSVAVKIEHEPQGSNPLGLSLCPEVMVVPYRKVGALEACWYMIRWKIKETFMPRFPDHPCAHPGCPRLVPHGRKYCDIHAGQHPEETRSASSRGYGKRWQKASKAFLRRHPLCAECGRRGRYVAATVVDHIMPHRGDLKLFWDESNWQPMCKRCHDQKTGREDSRPTYHY